MTRDKVVTQRLVADFGKDLKPRGELTIVSTDRAGNKKVYHTPNVITFDARAVMGRLLVGEDVATTKVAFIQVGSDNTTPTRSDTSLHSPVGIFPITSITHPSVDGNDTEMSMTIGFEDLNDAAAPLSEAALICGDQATMFARQVFGDITKTSSLQLQFIWRIIYT